MRHTHKVHAHEVHVRGVHVHEVHTGEIDAREMHAYEMHAYEIHAYEGFCEDLARQNAVAHLFQLQPGFRRCRIWVSAIVIVS
jgi:hypothetical protein